MVPASRKVRRSSARADQFPTRFQLLARPGRLQNRCIPLVRNNHAVELFQFVHFADWIAPPLDFRGTSVGQHWPASFGLAVMATKAQYDPTCSGYMFHFWTERDL